MIKALLNFHVASVMVNDQPAKGHNYYSDISYFYASTYEINATGSRDLFSRCKSLSYIFIDKFELLIVRETTLFLKYLVFFIFVLSKFLVCKM